MISAKIQIDNLLQTSQIVVILNQNNVFTESVSNFDFKSIEPASFKEFSVKEKDRQFHREDTLEISEIKSSFFKNDATKIDTLKMLEIYGISKEFVHVVKLEQLKNFRECDLYIRKFYCNDDENVQYPLIFIHGVYFGSDEEINLAHNEGFLFELFRDIGLYGSPTEEKIDFFKPVVKNHFQIDEHRLNLTIDDGFDDDDFLAIEKVAQSNADTSLKKPPEDVKKIVEKSSNISFNTLRDYNSEHSSLNSVNRQSFTQNYINGFNGDKSKISNKNSKNQPNSSKNEIFKQLEKSSIITDFKKTSTQQREKIYERKITPPGDVLATINNWLKKTKVAIELRNKQLEHKNN